MIMAALYRTKANAVGGRSGTVKTEDGQFSARLGMPKELGGKGEGVNPEQLFASGYAACFGSAMILVARQMKLPVGEADVEVSVEAGLEPNGKGGFMLLAELEATARGLDQPQLEKLVSAAHAVCPYSNAISGNVNVKVTARVSSKAA
jgi:Ohr subfamily peroxiredoxin